MKQPLQNPVYNALISGDGHLSLGTNKVKFFDSEVSPFAGFEEGYTKGFDDLFDLLPAGRLILYATPENLSQPRGWQRLQKVRGIQMIFSGEAFPLLASEPVQLGTQHVEQMIQLAELTRPGPFGRKTILFGHYHGILEKGQLIAMTGQRLHIQEFTEISAVCTHPDHLGKGYASLLLQHQVNLILRQDRAPILHVRKDNRRAIEIYERMGFQFSRPMNFYFMKRRKRRLIAVS